MEQIIARAKIRFCLTLPSSSKTQLNMECQVFLVVSLYSAITSQRNLKGHFNTPFPLAQF